ncbi:MAG TPA: sulfatase [Nocardioidaceae bacterium]|nr:sulfatase [Nocardioidaceae bacterium]
MVDRRWRRALVLGAFAVSALLVAACTSTAPISSLRPSLPGPGVGGSADRPNIVFVLTDDLSWNLVRFMPQVREMEHEGVTFSRYFVTDSLCCPSRSSIFTGDYPHDTGVIMNTGPNGGFRAFLRNGDERRTFALRLRRSGYRTAILGKYLNGYPTEMRVRGEQPYRDPGWSLFGAADVHGYREYGFHITDNRSVDYYGFAPRDYMTSVLARKAHRFISSSAAAHKPFLLEVATFAPHRPFVPAPQDVGKFPNLSAPRTPAFGKAIRNAPRWMHGIGPLNPGNIRTINQFYRLRAESVLAVDRMLGSLRRQLDSLGIARNTYVIFSSDNGFHMGEHDLRPGKQTAFDTDIRVPLVLVGPGVPSGRVVKALAENIDLCPTFERLGGTTPLPTVDGRSLVPLIHGHVPRNWRTAVLIEHHGPDTNTFDPDFQYKDAGNPPSYEAIRTAHALYVQYVTGGREFYNLRTDPYELDNRVATMSPVLRNRLRRTLLAMEQCHGERACWAAQHLR